MTVSINDLLKTKNFLVDIVTRKFFPLPPHIKAKDIRTVAETGIFIAYTRGIDFSRSEAEIDQYIYRVMVGEVRDFWRKESWWNRRTRTAKYTIDRYELDDLKEALPRYETTPSNSSEDFVTTINNKLILENALCNISERNQKIVEMKLKGFKNVEIARDNSLSDGAVSIILKNVTKKVKLIMEEK